MDIACQNPWVVLAMGVSASLVLLAFGGFLYLLAKAATQ